MSEKQEKKRRYNQRLAFIAAFEYWLKSEPHWWRFISHYKWRKRKPEIEDYISIIDDIPDYVLCDLEDWIGFGRRDD